MTHELWADVDRYLITNLIADDPGKAALTASLAAGLPPINVSATYGKLLQLFARMQQAKTILEIGTLGAYSTIWFAGALPSGGTIITLEVNPAHAELARANVIAAGVADRVDIRLGPAIETLPTLVGDPAAPFDLIFIDADKKSIPEYFQWALKLSRPGTLLIVDNVIRDGKVIDATSDDPDVQGVRRLNELLSTDRRVSATALQTVGGKGYDGFVLALVN
jgi:predicted O-methyltransferase YrrM